MPHIMVSFSKPQRPKRKPLRSLIELADEFGVSRLQLSIQMAHDVQAGFAVPKPKVLRTISSPSNYYDPDEMRKWWKNRNERKAA